MLYTIMLCVTVPLSSSDASMNYCAFNHVVCKKEPQGRQIHEFLAEHTQKCYTYKTKLFEINMVASNSSLKCHVEAGALCMHRARVLRRFFQILRSERNPQSERQSHEGGDIVVLGRAFYSSDEEGPEQRRR
jgi:hypothetical protein